MWYLIRAFRGIGKEIIPVVGTILLGELIWKALNKYRCPRCNYPIGKGENCPNCNQPINWEEKKPKCPICNSQKNIKRAEHLGLKWYSCLKCGGFVKKG